ncbi:hypothetical protein [Sinorhizobium terangae]|nr:hypothetical protein [Sinorhizobium terangae]WFU51162.1 hypothetical protein QA637_21465 [Sinorhizobium terangae]
MLSALVYLLIVVAVAALSYWAVDTMGTYVFVYWPDDQKDLKT